MTITRKDIDDFAFAILGRRLSRTELDDLARQCKLVGLRPGDEAYLLGLVQHRDLTTRLESIAFMAVRDQSRLTAVKRLRSWIITAAIAASVIGLALYDAGHGRGYALRERMVAQDLAWTATPAGIGARLLYDTGIVPFLLACSLQGWSQNESLCVPGVDPVSKQMFGIPNRRPEPPG